MNNLTLYGITNEMQQLLRLIEENEGEMTPEIENALAISEDNFAAKSEDYGHAILNLKAMAVAAKAEKERLAALQKFYENAQKRLTDALSTAMQVFGKDKVENATMRLSLRHTTAVADDYNIDLIPREYKKTKIEVDPDKTAIKKAILEAYDKAKEKGTAADVTEMGAYVNGCRLVENVSLQIK